MLTKHHIFWKILWDVMLTCILKSFVIAMETHGGPTKALACEIKKVIGSIDCLGTVY